MSDTTAPLSGGLLARAGGLYARLGEALDRWAGPPVELAARVWLGLIFFKAGLTRVNAWDSQAFLFDSIHPVPFLPAEIAAVVTTAGELLLPVLLWLGLAQRLAALGLFAMTATIQFVVAQTPEGMENRIGHPEHYAWMLGFLLLAVRRPSILTLDHWLCGRQRG